MARKFEGLATGMEVCGITGHSPWSLTQSEQEKLSLDFLTLCLQQKNNKYALRLEKRVIQHTKAFSKLKMSSNLEIRTVITNVYVYFTVYYIATCFGFLKTVLK
jgi:hypothetical protein